MAPQYILQVLKNHPLFKDLSPEESSFIASILEEKSFSKGSLIMNEGEPGTELYLILEGEVEIVKKDPVSGSFHQVSVLQKGDTIGEMALLDHAPRSASARAVGEVKLLSFPLEELSVQSEQKKAYAKIILNLSKTLSERLRTMDSLRVQSLQAELEKEKLRAEMGRFLFAILIILSVWILLIDGFHSVVVRLKFTSLVSTFIIGSMSIVACAHIKMSVYPASFFGLTLRQWPKKALESLLLTFPLLVLCTGAKWLLVQHYGLNEPVIDLSRGASQARTFFQMALPYLYILFVPLQEFISRGGLQSSIYAALPGKRSAFWSIILSSLIFSSFHSFVSAYYALAALLAGFFWGWIYDRQKSLVGPIVSHMLVGWWVIQVLGAGRLLTGSF